MSDTVTLYHGTCETSAARLAENGWEPKSWPAGGQCGNPRLLYLTTTPENALWYANEKGSEAVLEVDVPRDWLIVDPEDGVADTVAEELRRRQAPGNVALTRALPADAFRMLDPAYRMTL